MKWNLAAIAHAVDGDLLGSDEVGARIACGISTDSRDIPAGALFIALKGERFDAHDFLHAAQSASAAAVLISAPDKLPEGMAAVVVKDTRLALGKLAAAWRNQFDIPLIGVTGSNGKTTTKEMIASILKVVYGDAVLATQGNFNNDIGLPLTLLGLNENHRAVVIEMGMNHPGEIAYLTQIAQPTAAVVTNAQRAHLQGMGDLEEVAREKGSIYRGLRPSGVAAVLAGSPYSALWQQMAEPHAQISFGLTPNAAVRGELTPRGIVFQLSIVTHNDQGSVQLRVPGRHNAENALAAAAACLAIGLPLSSVLEGLAQFSGVKGRLQTRALPNGAMLLDDTYNANPDSVRAGIDVLAATVGRKILVLGDMGEIGDASAQYHDEVGGYAKSQGVDFLLTLGESSPMAIHSFGQGGQHFKHVEGLIEALRKLITEDSTVLVKGSRFMKMERVSNGLTEAETQLKESQ
jgi:UDP-N-acetylmuramoyl-tripeptide--D-alanyl-D-alanine ligase